MSNMSDLSHTETTRAMNQGGVTHHDKNPAPTNLDFSFTQQQKAKENNIPY